MCLPLTAARPASAQEDARTDQQVELRADRALHDPLFSSPDVLTATLATDIDRLRRERPDKDEVEGTLSYVADDGSTVSLPVKVRTRGNFRRKKSTCSFPPLRLNVARKRAKGTWFERQDKLKLVSPCRIASDTYQEYVLQEYLVYRVYALLTPACFRVRLLRMTYEDTKGDASPRTRYAFLIEDVDDVAARNRGEVWEQQQLHPARFDDRQSAMMALFQYMIGNTDWSAPFFHNVKLMRAADARYVPVPYDFDFSGVVDARYATPDPKLNTRTVRDRVFRGFCRSVEPEPLVRRFNDIRDDVRALYEGFEPLSAKARRKALKYYDVFYRTINDPSRFAREITRACRKMPA